MATLMVQGTASGVGKSTLVLSLCRIFTQDGLQVAPFKAQNLSERVYDLPDGRVLALSQALAAFACGMQPHPDMNPVLLRTGPNGADVVLDGVSIGSSANWDETVLREKLRVHAHRAYARLKGKYDIVVAEGAGSAVECNLREKDIVNMNFALHAQCPVLLLADISRGGVFASVYGTLELLAPEERKLVKGIVLNRFDGLREQFADGVQILEQLTGLPVLGVIPRHDILLEDEDLPEFGKPLKTRERLSANLPNGQKYECYRETQFDAVAELVRNSLDMDAVYSIVGCCPAEEEMKE